MRWGYIHNFALAIFGIAGGGVVAALIGLNTDSDLQHHGFWIGFFTACVLVAIASAIVAILAAINDRTDDAGKGRRRMIALLGMILCGLGLAGFSAWYFWPSRQEISKISASAQLADSQGVSTAGPHKDAQSVESDQPAHREPINDARTTSKFQISQLKFAGKDNKGNTLIRFSMTNIGAIPGDAPNQSVATVTEREFYQSESLKSALKKVSNYALTQPLPVRGIDEVEHNEERSALAPIVISSEQWTRISRHETRLHIFIVLKYADRTLPPGSFWVTEFAAGLEDDLNTIRALASRTYFHWAQKVADPISSEVEKSRHIQQPQAFWPVVGCAMAEGVPSAITPFDKLSPHELKLRVAHQGEKLKEFEQQHNQRMEAASAAGGDFAAVQAAIQSAEAGGLDRYRKTYLEENVALLNELLKRLKRVPPTTTADGVSVDGFATVCGGYLRGKSPLTDLASYLERLAGEIPAK